jgi:hypothetical protein
MKKTQTTFTLPSITVSLMSIIMVTSLSLLPSLTYAQSFKDTFKQKCDPLITGLDEQGNMKELEGLPSGVSSDQWCANHGLKTNDSVSAWDDSQYSSHGASYAKISDDKNCPGTKGMNLMIMNGKTEDCTSDSFKKNVDQCKTKVLANKNKMILPYCLAYQGSKKVLKAQAILITLDVLALNQCIVGCSTLGIGGPFCIMQSNSATLAEMISRKNLKKDFDQFIEKLKTASTANDDDKKKQNNLMDTTAKMEVTSTAIGNADSCMAMTLYTAIVGVRSAHIDWVRKHKKDLEKKITDLDSNVNITEIGDFKFESGMSFTNSDKGGGPRGLSSSAHSSGGGEVNGNTSMSENLGATLAATAGYDSDTFKANLDGSKQLMDKADKLGLTAESVTDMIGNDGDPSALISATGLSSPMSSDIAQLAKSAKDLKELGAISDDSPFKMVAGAGGAPSSDSSSGFGDLFKKDDMANNLSNQTEMIEFGRKPASTDIWHTGSKQSLFEIISGKYSIVTDRMKNTL